MLQDVTNCSYVTELPPDWPMIRQDQTPTTITWKLPLMYREGNNGVMYLWQVGFNCNKLAVLHGPHTSCVIDITDIELNSSGRSINDQALLNARAKFKKKFHKGYVVAGSADPPKVTGMKGVLYKPGIIKNWPVLASPKLDGIRLLSQHMGGNRVECRSYGNIVYKHLGEIETQVCDFLAYFSSYATLDGELYCHGMTLHQIASAVKTINERHVDLDKIQYHIFDVVCDDNPPSEYRYSMLQGAYVNWMQDRWNVTYNPQTGSIMEGSFPVNCKVIIVPQTIINNDGEVENLKTFYTGCGYEGLVLRPMAGKHPEGSRIYESSRYRYGRSTKVYKVKSFIDEEGTVIDVTEATGKEHGAALLVIRDCNGAVFPVRFGSMEEKRYWLLNPRTVIGKSFTFRHCGRSVYNVPQQPTGVTFRDYE